MITVTPKKDQIEQEWFVVDATDQVLGRLSTKVATILRGKHKPIYTPHLDTGDFVIVINAEKIHVTGSKDEQKLYDQYSGYPSGLTQVPYRRMLQRKPEEIIRRAVKGMLPKSALGRKLLDKLKIYAGPEHKHDAQQPKPLEI
ncbi:MAG: 50S ribosomal protein L13 [Candidatus Cloacimonetes bacterium]|nr:50S ribosomal protein L13 [Candidatus Cloacimonadota bacterium]